MADEKQNVVESILYPDEDEEEIKPEPNSLQETIKELGNQAFKQNLKKLTYISNDNKSGLIQAEILNAYTERNFGYRYASLDALIDNDIQYSVSVKGYGFDKMVDLLKSIQASFEQTQLPQNMQNLLRR